MSEHLSDCIPFLKGVTQQRRVQFSRRRNASDVMGKWLAACSICTFAARFRASPFFGGPGSCSKVAGKSVCLRCPGRRLARYAAFVHGRRVCQVLAPHTNTIHPHRGARERESEPHSQGTPSLTAPSPSNHLPFTACDHEEATISHAGRADETKDQAETMRTVELKK